MNTQSAVIILILIVMLIPAVKSTIKHMRGEGACCGGAKEKPVRKKIKGKKQSELIVKIEGMHCVNCKNRIENHLNALDGVVAKVSLEKKQARVLLYQEVDHTKITEVIEALGFAVTELSANAPT
ncbi:MAG: heavy metal-associated domain-containing protein [Eubacteriales bacterium]|nr:heavy metal-associated domain-containing protein [Eubacteriales bacterium]